MVSISRRFLGAFVSLIVLPNIVVSVVLSRLYLSALYETLSRQTEATARQASLSIENEVDGATILAASLLHDAELRSLIDEYAAASGGAAGGAVSDSARLSAYSRLDKKVMSFFTYSNRIGGVVFYLKDGRSCYFTNYPNLRLFGGVDRSSFAAASRARGEVYVLDTLSSPARGVDERDLLSVAVYPSDSVALFPPDESGKRLEAVLAIIRVPFFDGLVSRAGPGGGDIVVFGRGGGVLLSSLPKDAAASFAPVAEAAPAPGSFREIKAGGKAWLATLSRMDTTGWTIVLLTDEAAISNRITRYGWYLFPSLAAIVLLCAVFVEILFAKIGAPVAALIAEMERVGKGDYTARVGSSGIAELEALTEGFNSMVSEVRDLTAEREKAQHERLLAELEALRYQINPHFIANTLNSIRMMALAAKADSIASMSADLMRVLSDCYAGKGSLVELSREMENAKSYTAIMKVRFGKLFDVDFDMGDGTERALCLRMMLQPIVENSILHGFGGRAEPAGRSPRAKRGRILVSSRIEESALEPAAAPDPGVATVPGRVLVIAIEDDGAGMEGERVRSALEDSAWGDGGSRIGIANVQRRIRLNFGSPYGLEIESFPGEGTVVRFVLPLLTRLEPEDGAGA
jgi:two-component system sensor histidine kinase YesM